MTAVGCWGQARVTGHEATRGTEQDRQIGTFALSRARKLAKRPESTYSTMMTNADPFSDPRQDKTIRVDMSLTRHVIAG